ncbi:MAG: uroporphyrinogen-III synthase, partial [Blastocatellia bacterium]
GNFVAGLKILIPRAAVARDFLPRELARLGAHVEAVEAYRTVKPEVGAEAIFALFRRGEVDVVAFTSSSTVTNFAALAGETNLADLLREVAVACIGPLTATTASDLGLRVVIQPESYSGSSLVQAISEYFSTLDS